MLDTNYFITFDCRFDRTIQTEDINGLKLRNIKQYHNSPSP